MMCECTRKSLLYSLRVSIYSICNVSVTSRKTSIKEKTVRIGVAQRGVASKRLFFDCCAKMTTADGVEILEKC